MYIFGFLWVYEIYTLYIYIYSACRQSALLLGYSFIFAPLTLAHGGNHNNIFTTVLPFMAITHCNACGDLIFNL